MADQINIDLTYSMFFNLANQYHVCGMYTEALNTYSLIVKNKQYAQSGRLRVNMGNIYYEQVRSSPCVCLTDQPHLPHPRLHAAQPLSSLIAEKVLCCDQDVPNGARPDPKHRAGGPIQDYAQHRQCVRALRPVPGRDCLV